MKTLADLWLSAVQHNPDQLAIVDEWKRLTYRQVMDRASRLANALYARGLRKHDRVAVLSMNRSEWYDVYAACNTSAYIVTTVNFRLAPPEILFILDDSKAKVLVYEDQYAETVERLKPNLPHIELFVRIGARGGSDIAFEDLIESGHPAGAPIAVEPSDYAHLIYTSGTTGRPKGVIRSQWAEARNAEAIALYMNMAFGGRLLLMMPMFHIGALAEAHAQLFCRGTVFLQRAFDPAAVLEAIGRERIECTHMAPTMVQAFLDVPNIANYDLSSLRTLCYAAAPMPVSVLKKGLELLGPIFVDCYGSTEVGAATALHKYLHRTDGTDEETLRLGSVGQPLTHAELRIVDEHGVVCPPRGIGEVSIRADSNLSFYWNNHPATIEALNDGWFATGDMGFVDELGFLFLVDRKKDMIISGGENIYCREVEEAIMAHAEIADVAVIGIPDERWGESVKAIVVRRAGSTVTEADVIAHCLPLIARYKKPKVVEFVESLPRLPSGKVNKVALRELHRAQ